MPSPTTGSETGPPGRLEADGPASLPPGPRSGRDVFLTDACVRGSAASHQRRGADVRDVYLGLFKPVTIEHLTAGAAQLRELDLWVGIRSPRSHIAYFRVVQSRSARHAWKSAAVRF